MKKVILLFVSILLIANVSAQGGYSVEERQSMFLKPEYLANWVGASFLTREALERDLEISPITYQSGMVFYDLNGRNIGVKFEDTKHVCVELSFRLFGTDALKFKDEMIAYGYELQDEHKSAVLTEEYITAGSLQIYRKRLKDGYSICEVINGQSVMFTFYRKK